MKVRQSAYTISANSQKGRRSETRIAAASALCLADDWVEAGYTNVVVTDPTGKAFEPEAFRATLPLVRRMAERRR